MAKGPGTNIGYGGAAGRTRTERVQYTCPGGTIVPVDVRRCVNAATHPRLARRLVEAVDGASLDVAACEGCEPAPVWVSVVYHDPAAEAFVLVIPPTARHTEAAERQALLARLGAETDAPIPTYVLRFDVAFGSHELREVLARGAAVARGERTARELVARRERVEHTERALATRRARLDDEERAFEKLQGELEARNRERTGTAAAPLRSQDEFYSSAQRPMLAATPELDPEPEPEPKAKLDPKHGPKADPEPEPVPAPDPEGTPLPRPVAHEDIDTSPVELLSAREIQSLESDGIDPRRATKPTPRIAESALASHPGEVTIVGPNPLVDEEEVAPYGTHPAPRARSDARTTSIGGTSDIELERWIASREPTLKLVTGGQVLLAATAEPAVLESLLREDLRVRVQLHRMPTYPLLTLRLGSRDAAAGRPTAYSFLFDVDDADDRDVLNALAREFAFQLHLFDGEYLPVAARRAAAPLADNVRYALAAADAHLVSIARRDRSLDKAEVAWSDPRFDQDGALRPERALFRDELFDDLDAPSKVREALQVAIHFSRPALEELLVLVWGETLPRWNQRRGKAVLKAVEVGLWPGPELARIAISAGAARSRKDLVSKLIRSFQRTVSSTRNDLDADAIELNWAALRAEQAALSGEDTGPRSRVIEGDPSSRHVVSGTIGEPSPTVRPEIARSGGDDTAEMPVLPDLRGVATPSLLALLDDKERRRSAAGELARRAEPTALARILELLQEMTRAESVDLLGQIVCYGSQAVPGLVEALGSHKGFVRQGSALALAVLKDPGGVEALIDRLLEEPTEIWREMARAAGEVGKAGVAPLAARCAAADEPGRQRIAWALAQVAARSGSEPVEALANGSNRPTADTARQALGVLELAKRDDEAVRGARAPADQTVNRAFSRRFFEALNREAVPRAETSVVVALDERDLIEDDGESVDGGDLLRS